MSTMQITSRVLCEMERAYSLSFIPGATPESLPTILAGSEGDGPLVMMEPPEYHPVELCAPGEGGFISIAPLVTLSGRFCLASTRFWPGFSAASCRIVLYPLDRGPRPDPIRVLDLPYTHRIALVRISGRQFLLASTLCESKSSRDDWSHPGGLHLAEVPDDPTQSWHARQVVNGLTKNHGLERADRGDGKDRFLVSCDEGLFELLVPESPDAEWSPQQLAVGGHSDAWLGWPDRSGRRGIAAITPFHGGRCVYYRPEHTGDERVVVCDDLEMAHTIWAGNLMGAQAIVIGHRRRGRETRLYRTRGDGFSQPIVLDEGAGFAQMAVFPVNDRSAHIVGTAHARDRVEWIELEDSP